MSTQIQPFVITATSKPGLIMDLDLGLQREGFLVPKEYADELREYVEARGELQGKTN